MHVQAITDFRALSRLGDLDDFLRRPRPTGDRRWDTLLAAAVARSARKRGITPPTWTRRQPLESWWFPPVSLDVEGLQVAVSSPQNLLAMKMAAGRPQDVSDLVTLFRHLEIKSPEQAVDIAVRMYGESSVVLGEPRESLLLRGEPRESLLLLAESVLTRVRAST